MPTYLEPFHGVTQSEALALAATAAPVNIVELLTYEMWHPSMEVPVRIVSDSQTLLATLEADAPRNPGEEVEFLPARVSLQRATESDRTSAAQVALAIDNVSELITDQLRAARLSEDPAVRDALWQVIERVYTNEDTSAPHKLPPLRVTLRSVVTNGATSTFTAAFRDSTNLSVPAITFTPEAYPGLL
jgi:hypothetical protein